MAHDVLIVEKRTFKQEGRCGGYVLRPERGKVAFLAGALSLVASGFGSVLYGCGATPGVTSPTIENDADVDDGSFSDTRSSRKDSGFFCNIQQDDCPAGSFCNSERRCEPGCKTAHDCDESTDACLPTHRCGCSSGLVEVDAGFCSNFGGVFEVSDLGCASCTNVNAYLDAISCGCPTGFPVPPSDGSAAARIINDCSGEGSRHGGYIKFCEGLGYTQKNDWAGVYEKDDDVPAGIGCRRKNTYTKDCTCPPGAEAMTFRVIVDSPKPNGGFIGSSLTMCVNRVAPTKTFGGAYQLDDDVPGGSACRVKNVVTQDCSCPQGTHPTSYRVEVDSKWATWGGGFIGSKIFVCIP